MSENVEIKENEGEKEEIAENVENFLEVLKDVDLIMTNFLEIFRRVESQVESQADKNLFELGEDMGVIKGYMNLLSHMHHNVNKNLPKEIITEMIKNLDILSSILINFSKNDINNLKDLEQRLEQRKLTFTNAVIELLEDILRK